MIGLRALVNQACPEAFSTQGPDTQVLGITADSREVAKGFIFAAIDGVKQDGHLYIEEAIRQGAVAILSQRPPVGAAAVQWIQVPDVRGALASMAACLYGNPSEAIRVIGITGTNGKTTTSFLIEHIILSFSKKPGVLGTISHRFNGKEIPATETTPGPVRLQALLSQMRDGGVEFAAMEVSSHALHQKRVDAIRFAAGIFTNLTQDHLDYHGTLDDYLNAKARLFEMLGSEATAILNGDDPRGKGLAQRTKAKVWMYSISGEADWMAKNIRYSPSGGTQFDLHAQGRILPVYSPLAGPYNVSNVLAALAGTCAVGFDVERAVQAISSFQGVPGRLEAVDCGQSFKVYIDFAHTPDGLENVLGALKRMGYRRLLAVFGCGGDRDRTKRPQMAAIAARFCDHVFLTSDNPRSEDPKVIIEQMRSGFPDHFKDYSVIVDRSRAVRQALLSAREGDAVVLAGKGHERSQIIGTEKQPYHERTEAEKVLNGF